VVPAEEVRMVRGKMVDGVWIKRDEDEGEDDFARSIQMYGAERTFIRVHK
jgi:DEAD/DEAH box helicase domain-containing protein